MQAEQAASTDYEELAVTQDGSILTIALNRPEKLNAFTRTMGRELRRAFTEATADDGVRVIVLTGTGRGFCAGADMGLLSGTIDGQTADPLPEGPIPGGLDLPEGFSRRYSYLPTVPKPILAAVNGPAAGLGLIFALYADYRIASDDAMFTTAFARRGLIAEHGIDWILPRLVGLPNALDLLLSARKVSAQEAAALGLVNRVVPADKLMEEAHAFARTLAEEVSPRSMRVMKEQLYRTQFLSLDGAIEVGNQEMERSFGTEDFKEGVAHFLEKRPPSFSGK